MWFLQFFSIHEHNYDAYVHMVAIVMDKFRRLMRSYKFDSTINLFTESINVNEKVIQSMLKSIPDGPWLSINHKTDFRTLQDPNEQKLYLIRYYM